MYLYIEYVFLNNLAINYLVCNLTLAACKEKAGILRLLLVSAIGAVFSVLNPFLQQFNFVIKIILSLLMVALLKKNFKNPKEFVTMSFIFYTISFSFAGAALLLGQHLNFQNGLTPLAVSLGVLLSFGILRYVIKVFYSWRQTKVLNHKVHILNANKTATEAVGYYDSGNKLYDTDGKPVIVISKHLTEQLCLKKSGNLQVSTVAGIKTLPLVNLHFKVYYDSGEHKLFCTRAAVADNFDHKNYDLILHKDMV
jgi:hypothetical protein